MPVSVGGVCQCRGTPVAQSRRDNQTGVAAGARPSSLQAPPTFESLNSVASSVERSAISPPPASVRSSGRKQENLLTRLRSNSGLSFHTNNSALRQYTDYNQDGSTKLSQFDPVEWRESAVVGDGHRESRRVRDEGSSPTPSVPDFFSREMVMMVLHNPTVSHRLWQFAQAKGGGENMEFLMKVMICDRRNARVEG